MMSTIMYVWVLIITGINHTRRLAYISGKADSLFSSTTVSSDIIIPIKRLNIYNYNCGVFQLADV